MKQSQGPTTPGPRARPRRAPGRLTPPHRARRPFHRRGLSLVEMLVSLAITAVLLTATMVAIDASFRAYAAATETASRQTSMRLVVNRLMTLVRTSTAHGPLQASGDATWPVTFSESDSDTLESHYLELIDARGNFVRIEYHEDDEQVRVITEPYGGGSPSDEPLIGGVTECTFHLHRRIDDHGVYVLERASISMKVDRDQENTLAVESGQHVPIHVVASTMPRKLE